jgi:hypothetical protein
MHIYQLLIELKRLYTQVGFIECAATFVTSYSKAVVSAIPFMITDHIKKYWNLAAFHE